MNKKLKLYCTIFIVALIVPFFTSVIKYNPSSFSDPHEELEYTEEPQDYVIYEKVNDEGKVVEKSHKPELTFTVNVEPSMSPDSKVLMSKSFDQRYKVEMQTVSLKLPLDKVKANNPTLYYVWASIMATSIIVLGLLTLWMLWLVIKVVRNIRRGEIFVAQFAALLEKLGKLLVALYAMDFIINYVFAQYCINNIHIAGYRIVFRDMSNGMYFFTGLALMIIAQIILMGKELKEEQELTI